MDDDDDNESMEEAVPFDNLNPFYDHPDTTTTDERYCLTHGNRCKASEHPDMVKSAGSMVIFTLEITVPPNNNCTANHIPEKSTADGANADRCAHCTKIEVIENGGVTPEGEKAKEEICHIGETKITSNKEIKIHINKESN